MSLQNGYRRSFSSLLVLIGLMMGSLWSQWIHFPYFVAIDDVSNQSAKCDTNKNNNHNSRQVQHPSHQMISFEKGRSQNMYVEERIFRHFGQNRTSSKRKSASHSSSCSKWAVLAPTATEREDRALSIGTFLQQIQESRPNIGWCIVAVIPGSEVHEYKGYLLSQRQQWPPSFHNYLHIVSLDEMARQSGTAGLFVRAMVEAPNKLSASKNAGYLYALQRGGEYILDLEFSRDMSDLWKNLEGTLFQTPSPDHLTVSVPLVGDSKFLNPHSYIFNDTVLGSSWPRGYPKVHDHPQRSFKLALSKKLKKDHIGVLHQLSHTPDVDAHARLLMGAWLGPTKHHNLHQNRRNPLLIPRHVVAPYNAKATLHTSKTLWAALLPITVSPRVADIWRSYMAQSLFTPMNLQTVVIPPPSCDNSKLFKTNPFLPFNQTNLELQLKEDTVFYSEVPDLKRVLDQFQTVNNDENMKVTTATLPQVMEELWIHLFEHGFLGYEDVKLVQLWLRALVDSQYDGLSQSSRTLPYYSNVVLMGQFNFATYPRRIATSNLNSKMLLQLTQLSKGDWTIDNEKGLVVQEDLVDLAALWVQKWREVFAHVVVRGPFSPQQVQTLNDLYGIKAHGMDHSRWHHTYQDRGLYSPIQNLVETLEEYKNVSKVEGVLYVHDDLFLNIPNLIQPSDKMIPLSLSKFPADKILAANQGTRESYFDPRAIADKNHVSQRSYHIYPDGTFSKLNGQSFVRNNSQIALLQSLEPWPWNQEYCIPRLVELAKDPRVAPYREQQGEQAGSILIPAWEPSDFLFVPTHYTQDFVQIAELFLDHQVFLECAMPTIVDMLRQKRRAKADDVTVETRNFCTSWDEKVRNTNDMIYMCQEQATVNDHGSIRQKSFGLYHPYKLSNGAAAWDAMFDLVTLSDFTQHS